MGGIVLGPVDVIPSIIARQDDCTCERMTWRSRGVLFEFEDPEPCLNEAVYMPNTTRLKE